MNEAVKSDKERLRKRYRLERRDGFIPVEFSNLLEVSEKMETMYKDKKSNIPESYGLMVIEKENQVNEQFKALNLKIKSKSTNVSNIESMAFESGCEKGSQFEITQGLEASENTTKEIATT